MSVLLSLGQQFVRSFAGHALPLKNSRKRFSDFTYATCGLVAKLACPGPDSGSRLPSAGGVSLTSLNGPRGESDDRLPGNNVRKAAPQKRRLPGRMENGG